MAENKKTGYPSHPINYYNKASEPMDKWITTLEQVQTLKSHTEDLDRKLLELQNLLGKMQITHPVESSNFYSVSIALISLRC